MIAAQRWHDILSQLALFNIATRHPAAACVYNTSARFRFQASQWDVPSALWLCSFNPWNDMFGTTVVHDRRPRVDRALAFPRENEPCCSCRGGPYSFPLQLFLPIDSHNLTSIIMCIHTHTHIYIYIYSNIVRTKRQSKCTQSNWLNAMTRTFLAGWA